MSDDPREVEGYPFEIVDGACSFCGEEVSDDELEANEGFCPHCDNILDGQEPE